MICEVCVVTSKDIIAQHKISGVSISHSCVCMATTAQGGADRVERRQLPLDLPMQGVSGLQDPCGSVTPYSVCDIYETKNSSFWIRHLLTAFSQKIFGE